uniref:Uncharacterized protein LOC116948933 isoform X1 n=1 Tax=Petromyzon marinus TaxID=7757 RepID=A0AAJ7TSE2_PETMA|nr:uncharacterized protein LOC116948933 isoform X1 [Petromyzon marinus]
MTGLALEPEPKLLKKICAVAEGSPGLGDKASVEGNGRSFLAKKKPQVWETLAERVSVVCVRESVCVSVCVSLFVCLLEWYAQMSARVCVCARSSQLKSLLACYPPTETKKLEIFATVPARFREKVRQSGTTEAYRRSELCPDICAQWHSRLKINFNLTWSEEEQGGDGDDGVVEMLQDRHREESIRVLYCLITCPVLRLRRLSLKKNEYLPWGIKYNRRGDKCGYTGDLCACTYCRPCIDASRKRTERCASVVANFPRHFVASGDCDVAHGVGMGGEAACALSSEPGHLSSTPVATQLRRGAPCVKQSWTWFIAQTNVALAWQTAREYRRCRGLWARKVTGSRQGHRWILESSCADARMVFFSPTDVMALLKENSPMTHRDFPE